MKLYNCFFVFGALFVAISGLPIEHHGEESLERQLRSLPVIRKKLRDHRQKVFEFGGNLVTGARKWVSKDSSDASHPFFQCVGCCAAVELLRTFVKAQNLNEMYRTIEITCNILNIQSKDVCSGIAYLFGPELVPILNSTASDDLICSFLLSEECTKIDLPEWNVPLPPKPHWHPAFHIWTPPPENGPKLKILQITDSHFDRSYKTGAKTDCGEPLCCRDQNGMATGKEKGAGKWGDWKCDIPERTFDSMLQHASQKHSDIDYIIWTGDVPAHDIWNQSREANLNILQSSALKIRQYFPSTPVFPAVGNHEAAPTDIFPPPGVERSISWLYKGLDKNWRAWLPPETSETIKKGGFYTVLVRPGFRIVSLNTNYCYKRNWWLMLDSIDPAGQLHWLVEVLKSAEDNNEKVHIIGHVAPGQSDCLLTWRDNYYKIVSRFQHTITNHFFGHSHRDEYEIYYEDINGTKPIGVGFLGPSVTTFTDFNPGYRLYFVDGDRDYSSRAVLNLENWVMDLEYSNKYDDPTWSRSYSAKEEYRMASLLPEEWHKLYEEMKTNSKLLDIYYKHSHKDSPAFPAKCDKACKEKILCVIRSCEKYS